MEHSRIGISQTSSLPPPSKCWWAVDVRLKKCYLLLNVAQILSTIQFFLLWVAETWFVIDKHQYIVYVLKWCFWSWQKCSKSYPATNVFFDQSVFTVSLIILTNPIHICLCLRIHCKKLSIFRQLFIVWNMSKLSIRIFVWNLTND